MTYTLAGMEVPKFVHALIRKLLLEAGYDHAVDDREGVLDMTHIGLTAAEGPDALDEMRAAKDGAYLERNRVVAALACCFPAGVARTAIEGWDPEWENCVYVDLPTGQVSWHFHDDHAHLFARLPAYPGAWDGHDTPEKYRRLAALQAYAGPLSDHRAEGIVRRACQAFLDNVADHQKGMEVDHVAMRAAILAVLPDLLAAPAHMLAGFKAPVPVDTLPTARVPTAAAIAVACKSGYFKGAHFVVDPTLGADEMVLLVGGERRIFRLDLQHGNAVLMRTELDAGGCAPPAVVEARAACAWPNCACDQPSKGCAKHPSEAETV